MIIKFLFYILALFVCFCFAGVLFFVWMVRKTKRQIDEAGDRLERERRRQQQRSDSGVRMEGADKKKSQGQKIFADDEGEYVDFEEET